MTEVRKSEGYSLLFLEIFIIILNTLTIIVIHRFKQKYNPDILIFTLAVADLLKAFIPLNMTLVTYLGGYSMDEGSPKCIIFGWTTFTLNSGIMLVMTVMAIDRYVVICCPFWYKHYLSKKRLIYTIIAVFVFSGLHSMLPLVEVGQMKSYDNGGFCHFDFDSTIPASRGYSIFVLILGISMLAVVIFCYTRAMFSIKGLIRRQRRMSTATRDIDNVDQKRQATNRMFARLMIVMMMAFCLSWLLFLVVVLQHVSGWFAINPEAHFWSMRLAVFNSVLNPIIGAAMCRPYRKGYVFILCKCLHCCGLCSSYNAEDPWTRSREMPFGSRNSSQKDQNKPETCETSKSLPLEKLPRSEIRNKPTFNSYYDSGIVSDSRGLSRKGRTKQIPGLLLSKDEGDVEPMTNISDTTNPQQHSSLSMLNIDTDSPTNQDEINGNGNGLINSSNENQPVVIDRMTPVRLDGKQKRKYGFSGDDQISTLLSSSLGRPPGKSDSLSASKGDLTLKGGHITEEKTSHGVKTPLQTLVSRPMFNNEQATNDTLPKGLISTIIKSNQNERGKSLSEKSGQRRLTSPRDRYRGANQEKAFFQTVQVTHFPIGTNSVIKTTALKSESSFAFHPVSLRGRSFIERTQTISQKGQTKRSPSLANDVSALKVSSASGKVNAPEEIPQETEHDPQERQHSTYPTVPKSDYDTATLLDTPRFIFGDETVSQPLPILSRKESFELVLSNTRCQTDSTACERLDLPPLHIHSSALKGGKLKRSYNWSSLEPDVTCTLPNTSPCTAGGSVICGPQKERQKENELGKDHSMAIAKENEGKAEAVGTVNYEGGEVVAEDVQVIFPYGAISKEDNHVTIKITLEKPFKHCDMIVKNGLENYVMFIAPVINLLPNGQMFKQPVTVTTKLTIGKEASLSDVLILHGAQARDGKIFWQDITHSSKIDLEKKEMKVEIEGFSRIAALLRLTSIFTKNVITRLNLRGFNYTMSVLFKDNHPHTPFGELALVFMSRDVYHEKCFRDHPSSALMQLKGNGFEELCSIDRPESNRIYNNESLKVSAFLGQDYKLTDRQLGSTDLIVESSTWWSTGQVIKLSLKGTDGVRILCGRIGIEGQYGHVLEETFCQLDRCGYVRRLLGLEGSIFNIVPIAKKLDVPEEGINEAIKTWEDDEEQLKIILQHWSKEQNDGCREDPAVLRNTFQGLDTEVCEVEERGKIHINHLRELAFEIQGLNHDDPHLMEYFTNQIRTLCDSILKDCCIEMDAEVSIENYPRFLSFRQRITENVALKLEKICSSSTQSINEDFFSIVPFLFQAIKEIFRKESPSVVQNGLKGLPQEIVSRHESRVRDAFFNQDILRLVFEVCEVLENLCLNNCEKHSTEVIESWSESLGIWNMSEFLTGFFQSRQDSKLHKRLQLFSRSLKRISADIRDVKEIEMRYFYNVALNLIKFATFDPSKLVRFELTDSTNSPVTCYSEAIKYDRPHDTYSQQFQIRKGSEDELQLGAIAQVHLDGRIRKVGAFESVITLPPSSEEELARCPMTTLPVTVKRERADSGNLRVVLSSTCRKNISEALSLLKRDLGDDIVDREHGEITESHLAVCCFVEWVGIVRLRLLYKWRSEAISVDSKDFVAIAEPSVADAYKSASDSDASSPFEAELAALSIASRPGDKNGNFVMDPSAMELIQKHSRQQCGRLELHLHQTIQKGQVCVAGEHTSLHMEMPNTAQSFLQEGLCAPSQKSITAGPSSNDAAVFEQEKNESFERIITHV